MYKFIQSVHVDNSVTIYSRLNRVVFPSKFAKNEKFTIGYILLWVWVFVYLGDHRRFSYLERHLRHGEPLHGVRSGTYPRSVWIKV